MTNITALSQISKRVLPTGGTELHPNNALRIMREALIARPTRFRPTFSAILAAVSALSLAVLPVWAQESSEIAKQAQNPIASLISVPFENDFNPQTGIHKEDSYVLEMKTVVPFTLSNDWNLITRTIIPVVQVPDLATGVDGTSGLGDVQLSLFLSPTKAGAVIWGAGPVVSFPTASEEILGAKKTERRTDGRCT